jgi:hypothetical protein
MTEKNTPPATAPAATQFDALLGELDTLGTLAKALAEPEDQETDTTVIQENADEAEANAAKKDGGAPLAKAMRVQGADGEEFDAFDAEELVKAMGDLSAGQRTHADQLEVLVKGMTAAVTTIRAMGAKIQEQGALLKSLGDQGRGRRSNVILHEKPGAAGSMGGAKPSRETILAKSMDALAAKKISAVDVSAIEATLNKGEALNPQILAAIGVEA